MVPAIGNSVLANDSHSSTMASTFLLMNALRFVVEREGFVDCACSNPDAMHLELKRRARERLFLRAALPWSDMTVPGLVYLPAAQRTTHGKDPVDPSTEATLPMNRCREAFVEKL